MDSRTASFRDALRHRDYRWLVSAFLVSNIGSWAYNVALIVWVFEKTNSAAWAGGAVLARTLPALLFSAYGGVLAERFERRNLMVVLNVTSAATHVGLAITVAADGPTLLALLLAGAWTVQNVIYEPAVIALTPQIVGEEDLAAANSLNGVIDNAAVVVGPAVGAGLVAAFSPEVALLVNAATFLYAALATARVRTRSHPTDVTEGGGKGPLAQIMVGFRALAESPIARALATFSIAASFFYGVDTVVFVVVSEENLGTGATGYGYLLTALGVGGILAAPLVNKLASRPNLGTIIAAGLAAYTLPTAALVAVGAPAVAFLLQVIRGAGTLIVDVLAITAMQRTLPTELVSRVYGVFISLVLAAISLGALLAPAAVELAGLDATLLIFGLGPGLVMVLGLPRVRAINGVAAERLQELDHKISVLERTRLFTALTRPSIEHLASAATEVDLEPGVAAVNQGEEADAMYVIADGSVLVSATGQDGVEVTVATLGPGDYFGEIGLLESAPRNATCRATEPTRLYRVDGDTFLDAVHHAPQAGFLERAKTRASQTHNVVDRTPVA